LRVAGRKLKWTGRLRRRKNSSGSSRRRSKSGSSNSDMQLAVIESDPNPQSLRQNLSPQEKKLIETRKKYRCIIDDIIDCIQSSIEESSGGITNPKENIDLDPKTTAARYAYRFHVRNNSDRYDI
jgi:hypothetical protein